MMQWLQANADLIWWIALPAVTFLLAGVLAPLWIIRMPADFFSAQREVRRADRREHPIQFAVTVVRNLFGTVLVIAGIAMLVLPGPGVIAILLGITAMHFRGKRRLLRRIVRRPSVLASINWIRMRAGRPPLQFGRPPQNNA